MYTRLLQRVAFGVFFSVIARVGIRYRARGISNVATFSCGESLGRISGKHSDSFNF